MAMFREEELTTHKVEMMHLLGFHKQRTATASVHFEGTGGATPASFFETLKEGCRQWERMMQCIGMGASEKAVERSNDGLRICSKGREEKAGDPKRWLGWVDMQRQYQKE
jgi:hypothetical protein